MKNTQELSLALGCLLALIFTGCGSSSTPSTPQQPPPTTKNFLYAINSDASSVTAWQIDAATGGLTNVGGSPSKSVDAPIGATIDPASKFLSVDNLNGGTMTVFSINSSSGSLTPVAGSPFPLAATGGICTLARVRSPRRLPVHLRRRVHQFDQRVLDRWSNRNCRPQRYVSRCEPHLLARNTPAWRLLIRSRFGRHQRISN